MIVEGRTIAKTFWGKAWCENLERYRDFDSRLPRGRSYVRNRAVLDLQIKPLAVKALVSGSEIYEVTIGVAAVSKSKWQSICRDCAGGIDSLVELLQGRLSTSVMERICQQNQGLFPRPPEIKLSCSCPDYASMCKHVAAALYGVGTRLDEEPELLFRLRAVDEKDLLANLGAAASRSTTPAAGKVLASDDVSALFGLEMADDSPPAASKPATRAQPKVKTKTKTKRKSAPISPRASARAKPRSPKNPSVR
ncbi:SWIM zinc finger family protein [Reyranella sp.]|uniref:SWIM zinc finger family protein n=1 Tax=Reyranella sp. TaxID=1929291 RepID=UPI00272F8AA6|nr:SWIM zinc finger family protein [Reyranella sp.]MDP2374858.1 SWIM zinc finger family protein [Reyranella sp.]